MHSFNVVANVVLDPWHQSIGSRRAAAFTVIVLAGWLLG